MNLTLSELIYIRLKGHSHAIWDKKNQCSILGLIIDAIDTII